MKMDYSLIEDGFNMWTKFVIRLASKRLRFFGHCDGDDEGGGYGHCESSDYMRGYRDGYRNAHSGHCY